MNISKKITAAALAGVLAIGGATAVLATDGSGSGSGSTSGTGGPSAARVATLCEHKDEIVPKLTNAKTKVTERIATLTERQTTATDAGHTRVADRLQRRIDRLNKLVTRIDNRIERAPAWIAEHCS